MKCRSCGVAEVVLKTTRNGSRVAGCLGYPRCTASLFFPPSVLKVKVSPDRVDMITICSVGNVGHVNFGNLYAFMASLVFPFYYLKKRTCSCSFMIPRLISLDISLFIYILVQFSIGRPTTQFM